MSKRQNLRKTQVEDPKNTNVSIQKVYFGQTLLRGPFLTLLNQAQLCLFQTENFVSIHPLVGGFAQPPYASACHLLQGHCFSNVYAPVRKS
jgi:hypothetical protein